MEDLINGQPEQDIEHCATCIHAADSEDICILRLCKYAIAELKDCYDPKQPEQRWIPISKGLPSRELAIVQYSDGDFDLLQFPTAYRREDIVAWLPLSEPYKEDDHE